MYNNDIILSDRRKDIYPNNVIICPDNCKYKKFNIEEKIINCDCNLNTNKNYANKTDDSLKEDNGNFFTYFLDNINYGTFKCYNLFTYKNLKKNYAFYSSFPISGIVIVIAIYFWGYEIPKIRKLMEKEAPNYEKLYKDYIKEIRKINKIKRLSNKSSEVLLVFPPIKKFKRKKNKAKGKTEKQIMKNNHKKN